MVPEVEVRDLIISELQSYKRARGRLFSSPLAIRGRTTQKPSSWWEDWGGNTPNLQRLALRILSQPCSTSSCEHNWSLFDAIYTKKLYKLTRQRLNDLAFVKYNLRLRTRKLEDQSEQLIDLDEIDPYNDWTVQDYDSLFTEVEAEEDSLPSSSRVEPQAQSSRPSREPQSSVRNILERGKRKL
ncbi:uncharacterized protein LOC131858887 [Cryptomeria japonica]|uniref:uncharacterized protein LOC131858887 n=1 Tax=Cryptomeria japonica TaxID=3369 RepID=UPI0027DA1251|nr:uncharacterized protein LOC131858887 [Cryptomeria japonica]